LGGYTLLLSLFLSYDEEATSHQEQRQANGYSENRTEPFDPTHLQKSYGALADSFLSLQDPYSKKEIA
jgi:hypothetical protein